MFLPSLCFAFLPRARMAIRPAIVRSIYKAVRPHSLARFHAMSVARFPPHFANTDHRERCLEQLRSKSVSLEKYIYLNGLKGRDVNLFYDILLGNMSVRTRTHAKPLSLTPSLQEMIPILYTPTVSCVS